jgi:class 3 adenylate cyclase
MLGLHSAIIASMPRPELPSGTVTFLFTDVEGSTRLLLEHCARYADLLAELKGAFREAPRRRGRHAGRRIRRRVRARQPVDAASAECRAPSFDDPVDIALTRVGGR